MTDVDPTEVVKGHEKLTEIFGRWPSFHDSEVIGIRLDRRGRDEWEGPVVFVSVHVFEGYREGAPMLHAKKDARGHEQRWALIARHFGPEAFASVEAQIGGRSVAADDIADAFAALWSAERLLAGTARRLPDASVFDFYGLPMHIWY